MKALTATQHQVKLFPEGDESSVVIVDEMNDESEIRRKMAGGHFFRTPHGKRETITSYRGCLIVRNTVTFSGGFGQRGQSARKTTVYLFAEEGWSEGTRADVLCCGSDFSGIPQAKRYIDRMLKKG